MAIVIRTQHNEGFKLFFKSNLLNCENPGLFDRFINEMKEGGKKIPTNLTEFERFDKMKFGDVTDIETSILYIFEPIETELNKDRARTRGLTDK